MSTPARNHPWRNNKPRIQNLAEQLAAARTDLEYYLQVLQEIPDDARGKRFYQLRHARSEVVYARTRIARIEAEIAEQERRQVIVMEAVE